MVELWYDILVVSSSSTPEASGDWWYHDTRRKKKHNDASNWLWQNVYFIHIYCQLLAIYLTPNDTSI